MIKNGAPPEKKRYTLSKDKKDDLILTISGYLEKCSYISFAYVHGSFIENNSFSDIDVAVYYNSNVNKQKKVDYSTFLSMELTHLTGIPVDIHALNGANPGFCYEATKGIPIVSGDNEKRSDFVERNMFLYFDYLPLQKQNLRDLLHR